VLLASSTVRQAIHQLEDVVEGRRVVVVREHDGNVEYYTFTARALRIRLKTPTDDSLGVALRLAQFDPAPVGQLSTAPPPLNGVALEGRQVIGVIVEDPDDYTEATRGETSTVPVEPPDTSLAAEITGDTEITGVGDGLPQTVDPVEPAAVIPPGGGLFHAYPDVKAPGHVGTRQRFSLDVGFARKPSPSMLIEGPPIMVITGPKAEFIIQVSGFGFTFPDGIQRTLVVERDKPEIGRAEFTVEADASEAAAPRILEISYEYAGVVVGRTWAQIQVTPEQPAQDVALAQSGGSGLVTTVSDETAAHLSVDILSDAGSPELRWVFHTRYSDITRPPDAVTTNLSDDSARSFAVQLMKQIPNIQPGELLTATMKGIGKLVADAVPQQFWSLLAQAWRRARADGEQPRMQITLTEPWIPWELLWIDDQRLPDAAELLPPDAAGGATLGQLWQVARWTTPVRRLISGDVPASPPAPEIDADQMAVIVGNYEDLTGVRPLPYAAEEGDSIAVAYDAMRLTVSASDVTSLMNCSLQLKGQPFAPTAIHFAGHGQIDLANPQLSGLVLADGRRLDPIAIGGFTLVSRQRPFVFLNACEAGVADETLMNLGGMVGAFLREGARGFVAPLWKVDDVAARDIAIDFYGLTFGAGESVAEAMRQIRLRFSADSNSATSLAYVFYGSPDLRLLRGAA
jgi:hypothetical protein